MAQANPFDRFDNTGAANPFDQFDTAAPAAPAANTSASSSMLGNLVDELFAGGSNVDRDWQQANPKQAAETRTPGQIAQAATLGAVGSGLDTARYGSMALAGIPATVDAVAGTRLADPVFQYVTEPVDTLATKFEKAGNEISPTAYGVGKLGGTLGQFMAGEGVTKAPEIVSKAGRKLGELFTKDATKKLVSEGVEHAARGLPAAAAIGGGGISGKHAMEQVQEGVPLDQVMKAYAVNQALGTGEFVAPVSAPGNAVVRGLTGEALGLGTEVARQAAEHAVAPEGAPAPTMPDFTNPSTYLAGILAVAMGPRGSGSVTSSLRDALHERGFTDGQIDAAAREQAEAAQPAETEAATSQPTPERTALTPEMQKMRGELDRLLAGKEPTNSAEAALSPSVEPTIASENGIAEAETGLRQQTAEDEAALRERSQRPEGRAEPVEPEPEPRREYVDTGRRDSRGRPIKEPALDYSRDTLLHWLAANGGVNFEALRKQAGTDRADVRHLDVSRPFGRIGAPAVRMKGGMDLETLREKMQDDGWLPEDAPNATAQIGINDAIDLVDAAIKGEKVYHPYEGAEERVMRDTADRDREMAEHDAEMAADREAMTEAERTDAAQAMRDEGIPNDEESLTLAQWLHAALDSGAPMGDIERAISMDTNAGAIQRLSKIINESRHGNDNRATQETTDTGEAAPGSRSAAAGAEAQGQGFAPESSGQRPEQAPRVDQQQGLFAPATQGERVRAATEAKDAARNGRTGGHEDTGDGGLFDGERPEQTSIPDHVRGTTDAVATNNDVAGQLRHRAAGDESRREAIDEDTGLPLNDDGTVTVYHHTSAGGADRIRKTGRLKSAAEPDVYVTTQRDTDTGYGDVAVPLRVDPRQLMLDDEFPGGRKDFRIDTGRPGGSIPVKVENDSSAPVNAGAKALSESEESAPEQASRESRDLLERPNGEVREEDLTPEERELVGRARSSQARAKEKAEADTAERQLGEQMRTESAEQGERDADRLGMRQAAQGVIGDAKVEFVRDEDGLPPEVRDQMRDKRKSSTRLGIYSPATDRAYVFTSRVRTPELAAWTAAHEVAGHRGFRGLVESHSGVKVGTRGATEALDKATDLARQNPTVAKLADVIGKQRKTGNKRVKVEEALAELQAASLTGDFDKIMSQYGVDVPKAMRPSLEKSLANYVRRLKAILNAIYRKVTGKADGFTDEQVRDLLADAYRYRHGREVRPDAGGEALEQRVFHGTPHRGIKQFSLQKIGTGEGNQSEGWGIYFATRRDIADAYRESLSESKNAELNALYDERSRLRFSRQTVPKELDAKIDALERAEGPRGQLYSAEIPEDHELLDWDKPLSEQPEIDAKLDAHAARIDDYSITPEEMSGGATGEALYRYATRVLGGPRQASEYFNDAGILGLRYLDGDSRANGEGSYNYVIWDEPSMTDVEPLLESVGDAEYTDDARLRDLAALPSDMRDATGSELAKREASKFAGDPLENKETGITAVVSRGSLGKMLSKSSWKNSTSPQAHYMAVANLDKLFPLAIERIGRADRAGDTNIASIHHFDAPMPYDGQVLRVKMLVKETTDPNSNNPLYTVSAVDVEKPTSTRGDADSLHSQTRLPAPPAGFADRFARMVDAVKRGMRDEGGDILESTTAGDMPRQSLPTAKGAEAPPRGTGNALERESGDMFNKPFPIKEGKLDKARFYLQDKFIDLQRIQEGIETVVKSVLNDAKNVKQAAELFASKTAAQIEDVRANVEKPIIDFIHKADLDVKEVGDWLLARHAKERNARMREINPDVETGSGMTDAEADTILARYADNEAMQKIGKIADWMVAKNRQMMVEAGLITPEQALVWQAMYKHYVPLKGFEMQPEGERAAVQRAGRGFDVRGKIKHAYGRDSRPANPLANLLSDYERTIVRANKAEVGRALYRLAADHPNGALWELDKVPRKPRIDKETGLVTYGPDPIYKFADNVINVKIDGEDHTITMHGEQGERFAKAFKNLSTEMQSSVIRGLSRVNRYLAAVNTSLNPEFALSNFVRDVQTAFANLTGTEIKAVRTKVIKDIPKAMSGLREVLRKGEANSEWGKYAKDFRQDGGMTLWMDAHYDVDKLTLSLSKQLRNLKRGGLHPAEVLSKVGKIIEDYNKIVENGVRLSTYVHAREMGLSRPKAAHLAKDLTVNFDRKGQLGPAINSLYLFFNASVQGSTRVLTALKHPAVRKLVYGIMATSAGLSIANRVVGGQDDDGIAYYDKIPDYEKERNLIIMLPPDVDLPDWMESAEGGGKYLKLPLPYGYNVFKVAGDQIGDAMAAGFGYKKHFQPMKGGVAVMDSVIGAFNPLGSSPFETPAQTITPSVADPAVQIWTNKTWYGAPMYPEKNPFASVPKPDTQRYWRSTSTASRKLASLLGTATGGDKIVPGAVDISPITLDTLWRTVTGGAGATVLRASSIGPKLASDTDVTPREVPFVRRVMGTVNAQKFDRETYYNNRTRIGQAKKELDAARTPARRRQVLETWGAYLRSRPAERAAERTLRDLRDARDRVENSNLAEAAKEKRKEQIKARMHAVYMRLNMAVEKAREQAESGR